MGTITTEEPRWPELHKARRAIVVVDVVESVRLMQQHEDDVIDRWRRFVHEVRTEVLPPHGGRLVKSLGDGMLLEFGEAAKAVAAAGELIRRIRPHNRDCADDGRIRLRIGVHLADVVVDELDIYGAGVNLAARLASLAGLDEVVASHEVQAMLVDGIDACIEDGGDCYVKHLEEPIRVFRLKPVAPDRSASAKESEASTRSVPAMPSPPLVAVVFAGGVLLDEPSGVSGDILADALATALSTSPQIRLISRLSSVPLQGRGMPAQQLAEALHADYLLAVGTRGKQRAMQVFAELVEGGTGNALWAQRYTASLPMLLATGDHFAADIAADALRALSMAEARRAQIFPLPNLQGFSLQLAASSLMHRSSRADFARAGQMLEHLVERYPLAPLPRTWLAKWHVLQVTRGFVTANEDLAGRALQHTRCALTTDPCSAFALAMEGFVHCHVRGDLHAAEDRLQSALDLNPSESLAWLFLCVVLGFKGEGASAWAAAERALKLSPLDPQRHYYEALAASAALSARKLEDAVELARRSLRANRNHIPTLRALAIALVEQGQVEEARSTVTQILQLDPGMTINQYMARGPRGSEATRIRYAAALREAGVPAS